MFLENIGDDHVSQIVTFGTMAARMIVRDVGRALDVPYGVVDKIAKQIPSAPNMTLGKALDSNPDFKKTYETNVDAKRIIDIALKFEGMPRQASTHACRSCNNRYTNRPICTTCCK